VIRWVIPNVNNDFTALIIYVIIRSRHERGN
jgi:hypothetical protein